MKSFKDYKDLLTVIGAECKSDYVYGNGELISFLENNGSDEGREPIFSFTLEFNGINYELGVTHIEVEEDEFEYTYWLMGIKNLEGKMWKDIKKILDKYSTVDMSNFDRESGIVDFKGIYSDFSIKGYCIYSKEELVDIEIKDDEIIYRNN